jgi:hypothetical protein
MFDKNEMQAIRAVLTKAAPSRFDEAKQVLGLVDFDKGDMNAPLLDLPEEDLEQAARLFQTGKVDAHGRRTDNLGGLKRKL